MNIPRVASAPADPGQPSFLTTLPAETRNAIYEILFQREYVIMLHDPSAYYGNKPKRADFDVLDDYYEATRVFMRGCRIIVRKGYRFHHHFALVTPLLLSCRQIYHEGASMLYAQNTFLFSRAFTSHSREQGEYDQLKHASRWLSGIGSHINLLTNIIIDVDVRYVMAQNPEENHDLLPLVRMAWAFPKLRNITTFQCTGQISDSSMIIANLLSPDQFVYALNNAFSALSVDVLGLKRYSFSARLLKSALVYPNQQSLVLKFQSKQNCDDLCPPSFKISSNGTLTPCLREPRHICDLPQNVLQRIFDYACSQSDTIIFDIDNCKSHGLDIAFTQTCSVVRLALENPAQMIRGKTAILTMKTSNAMTNFDGFRSLRDFVNDGRYIDTTYQASVFRLMSWGEKVKECKPFELALNFTLDRPATLSELRIEFSNATVLLAQPGLHPDAIIRVTLTSVGYGNTGIERKEAVWSLAKLQRRLFLFLSHLVETEKARVASGLSYLPPIWFDGHGTLIGDTPQRSLYADRYLWRLNEYTMTELLMQGYGLHSTYTDDPEFRAFDSRVEGGKWADNTLWEVGTVWCALRICHWPDWEDMKEHGELNADD